MSWNLVRIGSLLTESKIESLKPNPEKRIRVRLNVKGVEKRPDKSEVEGATKQYIRKANQFIYGKQNFHKGAFGIIPKELDEFESSSDIPSFDVSLNCLPEWIFYFFKDKDRYLQLEKYATGVGSKRISPKKFFDIEIPLPPIAEQKIITKKIKASEEKDAQLQLQIYNQKTYLKNLRKQILQDAVEGKLTKEWREKNPDIESASELLKKIKKEKEKLIAEKKIKKEKPLPAINESEIPFEVPKSWVWTRLGEIGIFERGKSKHRPRNDQSLFKDGSIPFIQTGDVAQSKKTGRQILNCKTYYNEFGLKQSKLWDVGTLCITIAANIAETGFLSMKACFPDSIIGFKPLSDNAISKYVQFFIEISREGIEKYAPATAQKNINLEIISLLSIPTPPPAEQQAIVSKLKTLMQKLDEAEKQIEKSLENSKLLTKAILAEAFNIHEQRIA